MWWLLWCEVATIGTCDVESTCEEYVSIDVFVRRFLCQKKWTLRQNFGLYLLSLLLLHFTIDRNLSFVSNSVEYSNQKQDTQTILDSNTNFDTLPILYSKSDTV